MYAWKSISWLNLSFKVFGLAFLHMSTRIMEGSFGISSCVIWVGDGGGGVDTRSTIFLVVEVFVVFDFFDQPCHAPALKFFWNYVSNETLFATTYSIMSTAIANSSSSSSKSERIILCFPFPFVSVAFLLATIISFSSFFIFSLVMSYSRLSDSIPPNSSPSSFCCAGLTLFSAGLATCCSIYVPSLWVVGGMIVI